MPGLSFLHFPRLYPILIQHSLCTGFEDEGASADAILRGKALVNSEDDPLSDPAYLKQRQKDVRAEIMHCGHRVRHYLDRREQLLTELSGLSAKINTFLLAALPNVAEALKPLTPEVSNAT